MSIKSEIFTDKNRLISELSRLAGLNNLVFRGYSTQEQLMPRLMSENLTHLEIELLSEFEKYGMQYINAHNPIDFMSYAQHFGLSTRLLDFTFNPFIALYFAIYSKKTSKYNNAEDGKYYYIRYTSLDEQIFLRYLPILTTMGSMSDGSYSFTKDFKLALNTLNSALKGGKEAERFFEQAYNDRNQSLNGYENTNIKDYISESCQRLSSGKLVFVDVSQSNQRLIMQQGLFLFPQTLDTIELIKMIYENTSVIKIHKKLRNVLKSYLDNLGINSFRLMPDLPSICDAVEKKVKEDYRINKSKEKSDNRNKPNKKIHIQNLKQPKS